MNKEQTIEFLTKAANEHASDIFIIAGRPLAIKIDGHLSSYGDRLNARSDRRDSSLYFIRSCLPGY